MFGFFQLSFSTFTPQTWNILYIIHTFEMLCCWDRETKERERERVCVCVCVCVTVCSLLLVWSDCKICVMIYYIILKENFAHTDSDTDWEFFSQLIKLNRITDSVTSHCRSVSNSVTLSRISIISIFSSRQVWKVSTLLLYTGLCNTKWLTE